MDRHKNCNKQKKFQSFKQSISGVNLTSHFRYFNKEASQNFIKMPGRIPPTSEAEADLHKEAAQRRVTNLVFRSLQATGTYQKTTSAVRIELYEKAISLYQLEGLPPAEQVKFLELIINACVLYDSLIG